MSANETTLLLTRALEGDGRCLGLLLQRVRPRVLFWCATRVPPDGEGGIDLDELAHDCLACASRRFHGFAGGDLDAFLRWLFAVAEERYQRACEGSEADPAPWDWPERPQQSLAEVNRMCRALRGLEQTHRDVLRVVRFEGRSAEEAASRFGGTFEDVNLVYYRGLAALRQSLDGHGE